MLAFAAAASASASGLVLLRSYEREAEVAQAKPGGSRQQASCSFVEEWPVVLSSSDEGERED